MKINVTLTVEHEEDMRGASRDDVVDALTDALSDCEFEAENSDGDLVQYTVIDVNIGKLIKEIVK
jgi:hypothetical protein